MATTPSHPPDDEAQIRALVVTWLAATKAGDLDTVLDLMTEDVVFLVPGRAPMGKAEFAALSRPPAGQPRPEIAADSDLREVIVSGDWAYAWSRLAVTITPPGGAASMLRAGHALSVFRKVDGRWRLARDANLLAPVPGRPDNA